MIINSVVSFVMLLAGAQADKQAYSTNVPSNAADEETWMAEVSKQGESSVCTKGLFASGGVDLDDLDTLDKVFNDDSVMNVPQVGSYKGIEDIKEYVNFLNSDVFETLKEISSFPSLRFTNITDPEHCVIDYATNNAVKHNSSLYEDGSFETFIGLSIVYNSSETGITIKTLNIYFPGDVFGLLAGDALPDKSSERMCSIIKDSCEGVWNFNNLDMASCKEEFLALDPTDGDLHWIDGHTQGCKILHSTFAKQNAVHCPHISFKPMEDINGKIKCQTSAGVTYEDLFSAESLDFFQRTATSYGFDETMMSYEPAPTASPTCGPNVFSFLQQLIPRFV